MTKIKTFTAGLPVTDLNSAVEWYRRLLGEVEEVNPAPGVWEFQIISSGWSVVFAAINLVQSWRLFVERRPVKLTADEEEIRRLVFRELPPRKVLQVLSIGSWTTLEVGQRLLERGKRPDAVSLIVRGKVQATREGRVLGELIAGNVVGSALILSGVPAEVDAVTVEPGRAMRWELGALERYLTANPETRTAMLRHLARDLAGKVERAAATSSKPSDNAATSATDH